MLWHFVRGVFARPHPSTRPGDRVATPKTLGFRKAPTNQGTRAAAEGLETLGGGHGVSRVALRTRECDFKSYI
jgi:hypothetical protein